MNARTIDQLGDELHNALIKQIPIASISDRFPEMTVEEAYLVQQRMLSHRVKSGARIVGKKIGITSKAVMTALNVHRPDFGFLFDSMVYNSGDAVPINTLIQPKAEGEIAFLLKSDLTGPGVTNWDVLTATESVMACFEIVDSRIRDWKIKIQDTIADNASCGVFVLGDRAVDPRGIDLSLCGMVFEKNGEIVGTGAGAAALGSPVNAVAWLANNLGKLGISLKAGEVILSGALAAMVPAKAGDCFRIGIGGIGSCSVRFA
ncbi:MAG: 2-oxopent-4-enoate hydratase [Acidobacteriota bacterium]|nr:2-oxopent-4-enoate hydratase [Acidobacteriota bacterium]